MAKLTRITSVDKIQALELRLEESIRMIRLASLNQRTCLELEEWLNLNYPDLVEESNDDETIGMLLNLKFIDNMDKNI